MLSMPVESRSVSDSRRVRTATRAALVLVGFTAVIAQVVLMRELIVVFYGNEISLGLMLCSWLLWTSAGSVVLGRIGAHNHSPVRRVAALQVLLALALPMTIVAVRSSKLIFRPLPGEVLGPGPMLLVAFIALSVFCFVSGALFAAGSGLYAAEASTSVALASSSMYLLDWLVYAAYGLLPAGHPAVREQFEPDPLARNDRPFCLWEKAGGDYSQAISLIPRAWSAERRTLWQARITAIRDNEHIRRIEQPVYKRRWDEQWKVGNQWRCGEIAYAAEFIDAFEWWLKEKAEWWLEHKKHGGPVELGEWTQALWKDERIQAAWPVAAEQYTFLEYEKAREKAEEEGEAAPERPKPATDSASFARKFKEVVEEETVPAGFPFGVDYEHLAKKLQKLIPPQLKKVRGKLNVPRERFHAVARGQYAWAGLQFREKANGAVAGSQKKR